MKEVATLLAQGSEVGAGDAEGISIFGRAQETGDLLLQFRHPNIALDRQIAHQQAFRDERDQQPLAEEQRVFRRRVEEFAQPLGLAPERSCDVLGCTDFGAGAAAVADALA